LRVLLGALLFLTALLPAYDARAQTNPTTTPDPAVVENLLQQMTREQKVGQVFMLSFPGSDTGSNADIVRLINEYKIGGVQLKASAQNFVNDATISTTLQIASLSNELQRSALRSGGPAGVPLFIAVAQDNEFGGAFELNELSNGFTELPSPMALGGTWNTQYAQTAGRTLGAELSMSGVNVFFGPALDVVESPQGASPGDLGVRAFGGNPFWVARIGQALVDGLNTGGRGRVAVVAKNFPGLGASDRNAAEEIPTVQKSIDQLRQIDLLPYAAVMQADAVSRTLVDGLQIAHVRYGAFQGGVRPVSLDTQAYGRLLSLPETTAWRERGGVTFSEQLGTRSIRRLYETIEGSGAESNSSLRISRQIVRDAFAAGNDVLVLGALGPGPSWAEQLPTIEDTLRFFNTQYVADATFAANIDAAVRRILTLKLRLYGGSFALGNVLAAPEQAQRPSSDEADSTALLSAVLKDAATQIAPATALPAGPARTDTVVFFTDDRPVQECAKCPPRPALATSGLSDALNQLYGKDTTEQFDASRATSFALNDLVQYDRLLNQGISVTTPATATPAISGEVITPTASIDQQRGIEVRQAISDSNWIIFNLIDLKPGDSSSQAFRRFLASRADRLKDKRIVVFAFGAPYYLDATEVGALTEYYALYSRSRAAYDIAARLLFREIQARGTAPVNIDATQYRLTERLRPDPMQTIAIAIAEQLTGTNSTPQPVQRNIGDKIQIVAGPILDLNKHIVPDGTPAQFVIRYQGEEQPRVVPLQTANGIVSTEFVVERDVPVSISVESDDAKSSNVIRLTPSAIEVINPTAAPTTSAQPPTATAPPQSTPVPAAPPVVGPIERTSLSGFLLTCLLLIGVGTATFAILSGFRSTPMYLRVRGVLLTWIAGWVFYVLYALGAPGTDRLAEAFTWGGGPMVAAVFGLLVLIGYAIWISARRGNEAL
jgi:beta-N-acetylhexosaminidase